MTGFFRNLVLGLAVTTLASACSSKFAEKPPAEVPQAQASLQERVNHKASLDSHLNQLEAAATKAKNILALFQKASASNSGDGLPYSPLDLILDLSTELQQQIPEYKDGQYVKIAQLKLPIDSLSMECQAVSAMMRISHQAPANATSGDPAGSDQAVISLKTCQSAEKYVDTFLVNSDGSELSLSIKPEALKALFAGDHSSDVGRVLAACDFAKGADDQISGVKCSNLSVGISPTESILVTDMAYSEQAPVRLSLNGQIYGAEGLKGTVFLKIDQSGAVEFRPTKVTVAPVSSGTVGNGSVASGQVASGSVATAMGASNVPAN